MTNKIKSWDSTIPRRLFVALFDVELEKFLLSFSEMKAVQHKSEMKAGQ